MPDALREALRVLFRDVRFTAAAVSVLALTLGATTGVYAVVRSVVLQPFPFTDQDRLTVIWQRDLRRELPLIEIAHDELTDWRERSQSVDGLAVIGSVNWSLTLADRGETDAVPFSAVSASFFSVVGTTPVLGRAFETGDEVGATPRTMVISHGLWERRFGRDRTIIGRLLPVRFNQEGPAVPVQVIGVMPHAFDFPRGADLWMPAAPLIRGYGETHGGVDSAMRWLRVFYAVGRLRDGVRLDDATRELTRVMRTADTRGGPESPSELVLTPIAAYLLGPAAPVLWTLFAGASLMLLIACTNLAGLQVSRSISRQRALGIRLALGASNRRLMLQTGLESAMLTIVALMAAWPLAFITARALVLMAPVEVPRLDTVHLLDEAVLGFGVTSGFAALLVSGFWPALVAGRLDGCRVLVHGPAVASDAPGRRLQRVIVVAQVALALTLLTGTALFVRTVQRMDRTVLGFDPHHLYSAFVTPATDDLDRWNAFYDALTSRLEAVPGVSAASGVQLRPLSGPVGWDSQPIHPGQNPADPSVWGLNPHVNLEVVTPGYFRTMGIRLVRGRLFDERDTTTGPGVAVVSESAARRLWPDREAIGQQLRDPTYRVDGASQESRWQTVVGVVADVRYRGLNDVRLDLYLPATQSTNRVQQLMLRASDSSRDLLPALRAAALEVDPAASVSGLTSMREVVDAESAPWRFLMRIFMSFAATAALLTAAGLGAVIALSVTSRRRELAIRAALGAGRARLRATVLREGLWLVGGGCVCGLLGAFALGRGIGAVLVGVSPHDPLALAAAALTAAAVGLIACWVPARRAADADPIETLRAE